MAKPIERVTMFKIPEAEGRKNALDRFRVLMKTAVKDGKPYILACEAGEAGQDPRTKGWNVVVKSTFASKADMDYYDKECEAHNELKMAIRPVVEDLMTVWFESIFAE